MSNLGYFEDQREKLIESTVEQMLSSEGEFYPFLPNHLAEALAQADDRSMMRLAVLVASADELPDNQISQSAVSICLRGTASDYWRKYAEEKAENETPSAREMFEESKQHYHYCSTT